MSRRASAVTALLFVLGAVAQGGCGGEERPPVLGGHSGGGGGGGVADGGSDAWVDPDAVGSDIPWQKVGVLETGTSTGALAYIALLDDWLYAIPTPALQGGHRWKLSDATHEALPWQGAPDGSYETGGACQVGSKVYLLGGGGNGIFSPYLDYHYELTDLVQRAWLAGGSHDTPYHMPGIAQGGGRCFMLGGNNGGGLSPVAQVQELVPGAGTWQSHPPLPKPVVFSLAAFDQGRIVVAGGARELQPGDTSSTGQGVAVNATWLLDVDAPAPTWVAGPALPIAVQGGALLALGGRFYLLGGETNPEPGKSTSAVSQVLSWAPGDATWKVEGLLPIITTRARAVTNGTSIYAVVLATSNGQNRNWLYRWDP